MKYSMKRMVMIFVAATMLFACKKKYDEYYERPDDLEQPIYQVLTAKGNFKHFLAAVDKVPPYESICKRLR